MTIGIVLATTPGYSETFFRSKIKGLQAHGHRVILFVQQVEKDFDLCPVYQAPKVYSQRWLTPFSILWTLVGLLPYFRNTMALFSFERKHGSSWSKSLKSVYLNAHLLKHQLDWLHFGFATQALGREWVAKAIEARMAVSFRGFDINVYSLKHPGCYELVWQNLDKVHSISQYLLEKAYSLGLSKAIPYAIITPAVVLEDLVKTDYKPFPEKVQIITIARLNWIKGLDIALRCMFILKKIGIHFEYHIIGSGEQKETERYLYQVHELGLKNEVIFEGKLSHKDTLKQLEKADIYLQPSLNEGFCNAVLEAQALGKLCVASNVGGLSENIIHEETGWLFEVGNTNELANLINSIIELPEKDKEVISKKAKERVYANFDIKVQQEKFLKFYKI